MTTPAYTDSAGNELTEEQVWEVADGSIDDMSKHEVWQMLRDEWMTARAIPDDMLKCPCHGLWYDKCEAYA